MIESLHLLVNCLVNNPDISDCGKVQFYSLKLAVRLMFGELYYVTVSLVVFVYLSLGSRFKLFWKKGSYM